jgi:transposase
MHVFGVSGMAMLRALAANASTPTAMAQLARGKLRAKIPALVLALDGRLDEEHRFLLHMQLDRLEQVGQHLAALDRRIDQQLVPLRDAHTRLKTVPGIDRIVAFRIIAEIGVDMSVFASADDLSSWAGVCPGNHERAGKRYRGTTRPGNVHLTTALVEAAQAAIRTKGSYLREKFHRLRVRRGYNRALVAIAHKILIAVYHMLRTGTDFHDLGADYLDRTDERRTTRTLVHRLEKLGYDVQLTRKAA